MSASVSAGNLKIKRAYEPRDPADGVRILVDRLWPRGVSKTRAAVDQWMKDVAPSTKLRDWFGHDPARWNEFRRRYAEELRAKSPLVGQLRSLARERPVTLVYSARDETYNDAEVLREVILQ